MKKDSGRIDCVVIVGNPIISIEFDLSIIDVFTSPYSSHIPVLSARLPKAPRRREPRDGEDTLYTYVSLAPAQV
jgi:hypothetical protein